MRERHLPRHHGQPAGLGCGSLGGQHAKSATLTYIDNGGITSCAECHGADLSGGTSKVSCFGNPSGCHHGPVAGWVAAPPAAQEHGAAAKRAPAAPASLLPGLPRSGLPDPRGDGNRSCYSCHSLAPHPDGPWRTSTGSTHTNTDPSTPPCAPVATGQYPGTPGCFNSTLCHGPKGGGPGAEGHTVPFRERLTPRRTRRASPRAVPPATRSRASRRIPRRLSARCVTSPPRRCPSRTAPRATPGRRRGPSIRTSPAVTPGTTHWRTSRGCAPPVITASAPDRGALRPGQRATGQGRFAVPPGQAAFLAVYNAKAGPARSTTQPSPAPT